MQEHISGGLLCNINAISLLFIWKLHHVEILIEYLHVDTQYWFLVNPRPFTRCTENRKGLIKVKAPAHLKYMELVWVSGSSRKTWVLQGLLISQKLHWLRKLFTASIRFLTFTLSTFTQLSLQLSSHSLCFPVGIKTSPVSIFWAAAPTRLNFSEIVSREIFEFWIAGEGGHDGLLFHSFTMNGCPSCLCRDGVLMCELHFGERSVRPCDIWEEAVMTVDTGMNTLYSLFFFSHSAC